MTLLTTSGDPLQWMLGAQAEGFLERAYEREPIVVRHDEPDRFRSLLSIASVDRKIAELDLRQGMLEMADASRQISLTDFVSESGAIDRVAVSRLYRGGSTIILNQLHQSDLSLAAFCRSLETIFSCHVQTNTYLTPPGSQGFRTHYDNHDVFILQVEGEKSWRLYDRPVDAPYRGERFQHGEHPVGEPRHTFVLKAGDSAYVPRGLMHDASTSGDRASLHITCGLIVRTWADLFLEAVSEVFVEDSDFRRSLPPGFADQNFDRTAADRHFQTLLARVKDKAGINAAMDLLAEQFIRSREPDLSGAIENASLPLAERYQARPSPWRLEDDEEGLRLVIPGGIMTFSKAPRAVIERMLSGQPFTPADLGDGAEDLIRRLVANGQVERAD